MTAALQLLFAPSGNGGTFSGQLTTAPIRLTLDGIERPQALDRDGVHFVALTLGAQDLLGVAEALERTANYYLVEVDVRDRTMQEPDDSLDIEAQLLEYLQLGQRELALNFVTMPGSVLMWAIGLSSPKSSGTIIISRDGTLRSTSEDGDHENLDEILRAIYYVISRDT